MPLARRRAAVCIWNPGPGKSDPAAEQASAWPL